MVRWRNNEDTMMKTLCYDGENMSLRWWKYNGTIMKLRGHDDENVILFSPLCHRIILISQPCHRCYRVFITWSSRFDNCTIVHRGSGRQKHVPCVQTEHRARAIFERYNIVTRFASRQNLASCFVDARQENPLRLYTKNISMMKTA
jgi:hypothetical protein